LSRNSVPVSDDQYTLSYEVVVIILNFNSPDHDQDLRWQNRTGARPGTRVPGLEIPWNPVTNLALGPNDSNLF